MHLRTRAWRHVILALALVTLALPVTTPGASPASAQVASGSTAPASITGVGFVSPAVAFNVIGTNHTVTFTCTSSAAAGTLSAAAGCYAVQIVPQNASTGDTTGLVSATCAGATVAATGNTAACATLTGVAPGNTATATINPGAPFVYTVTFSGYVPASCTVATCTPTALAGFACPAGTSGPSLVTGLTGVTGAIAACAFTVQAQKKYVEITALTPTSTPSCGGTVVWSEALKTYLGPACTVSFTAAGVVNIKTVPDCTAELASLGTPPIDFGYGAKYVCTGNELGVTVTSSGLQTAAAPTAVACSTGVTATVSGRVATCPTGVVTAATCPFPTTARVFNSGASVTCAIPNNLSALPISLTLTGLGASTGVTFGSGGTIFCAGAGTPSGVTTNESITLCPTGFGPASIQACFSSTLNTQPTVCSAVLNFTFTFPSPARVVPYVRWAGEKTVLTKCFGGFGLNAGALVEFTLKGNNPGLNATLLPTAYAAPGTTFADVGINNSSTVYAVTDADGCASVILYADGEGVAYVDAALYSALPLTGTGGTGPAPIINEHAFEVFYLKFESVSLENIAAPGSASAPSFSTTGSITSSLQFLAGVPGYAGATIPSTISVPSLPGTGGQAGGTYPVQLCNIDLVRAMVHGYFEIPGDPSSRPASTVSIPGAPAGASGGFTLPAGRWVLPEDWPVLATFAGYSSPGQPLAGNTAASVWAWDLNSGFAFNPNGEAPVFGTSPTGPFFGKDAAGTQYSTAPSCPTGAVFATSATAYFAGDVGFCVTGLGTAGEAVVQGCGGQTIGIGPFDATQSCTNPYPLTYSPQGSGVVIGGGFISPNANAVGDCSGTLCFSPLGPNSTYLPNGSLTEWDAPMPPAAVTFGITNGPGFLDQVDKAAIYQFTVTSTAGVKLPVYYNPFYQEAIPASPLIPPVTNNGGYMWDSWGFHAGGVTALGANATIPTATVAVATAGCTSAAGTVTVQVNSTAGFAAGTTVAITGATTGTGTANIAGVHVTAVGTNTITLRCADIFGTGVTGFATTTTIASEQLPLPIPASAVGSFTAGDIVAVLCTGGGFPVDTSVYDVINGTVYLADAAGLLAACGGTLPAGTVIATGPTAATCLNSVGGSGACTGPGGEIIGTPATVANGGSGQGPYPFWQWVPNAMAAGDNTATAATVYSDNHGEAMVSLETGFNGQSIPAPAPNQAACTTALPGSVYVASTGYCLLPFTALAGMGFQNVKTALAGGPGTCIATSSTGTTSAIPGATIGAAGPGSGQICVNNLGNLEFGAGAALGTTTVQAIAEYPYTRGEHPQIGSGALTKVWTSAFVKSVSVSPATPGPVGTSTYTVTVTARDVCGNPLVGEPIQVYTFGNPGAVVLAPMGTGAVSLSTTSAVVQVSPVTGTATLSLEVLGQAVGNAGVVVKVVFPAEGIERFATVIAPTTPTSTVTQIYSPGYQQVGGPSGSNFGVAEAVFSYSPAANTYTNVSASSTALSSAAPACTGYWVYFAAPASVTLPATSKPGDTATCTLAAGWNLVGNPFGSAAALPSGTVAYHWNGTAYDTVGQIPLGGAVWVFNGGAATTITLTAT